MKDNNGLLIMIHCAQFTGYAVGVLERVFHDAAKLAGYADENIFWSYLSVSEPNEKVIACDYLSHSDQAPLMQFVKNNNIHRVLAFDLGFPAPVISALKKAGVGKIISYWGASMSSINTGFKLKLKKLEWMLRRNKPDHFIFESESMRHTAIHGRGVPLANTSVIPLGVDTERFTSNYTQEDYVYRTLQIPTDRKVIFYSGHMEERKGVRVIMQAAIHLVEQLDNQDVHFVICGNKGNEAKSYQALIADTKANDFVTFAGYRNDVAELMRGSYLGVIASTGWDSFTMSSVEMMASGLPLIVSRLQGLAETIENKVNGVLIEPGDFKGLAHQIDGLVRDQALAQAYSNASRHRAVSLFSRKRQVEALADEIARH